MKSFMRLMVSAFIVLSLFACGGSGGGGGGDDVAVDGGDNGCTTIGDASFNGASFEVYDNALSYVYDIDFDFSGTTLSFSSDGTDSPSDSELFVNVAFGDNRTSTVEGITFARSCNDKYLTYGTNGNTPLSDKFVALGIKNEFSNGNNALADGDYTMIQLMDDERNTGSYVFTDVFDLTFNGDGSGQDITNDAFNYNITSEGYISFPSEAATGQISEDGGVIVISKYNDFDDNIFLSVIVKKSSGNDDSTLSGVYNFTEIDGDSGDGSPLASDLESAIGSLVFDGLGGCDIKVGDGTFACSYNVADNGEVTFDDGWKTLVGMISPDSNLVAFASDDSGNEGPFYFIATKR